jgi:hypothetical protein
MPCARCSGRVFGPGNSPPLRGRRDDGGLVSRPGRVPPISLPCARRTLSGILRALPLITCHLFPALRFYCHLKSTFAGSLAEEELIAAVPGPREASLSRVASGDDAGRLFVESFRCQTVLILSAELDSSRR